ncbi:hypothetical protein LB506_002033 [Fusarium annulatum]|nr:hypothetical protein LB506_002033 [Fusarium annulatum]
MVIANIPFRCLVQTHAGHDPQNQSSEREVQLAQCKTKNIHPRLPLENAIIDLSKSFLILLSSSIHRSGAKVYESGKTDSSWCAIAADMPIA